MEWVTIEKYFRIKNVCKYISICVETPAEKAKSPIALGLHCSRRF